MPTPINLPPADGLPPELVAIFEHHAEVTESWLTAEAEAQEADALLSTVDQREAAEIRTAVRTGKNPADLNLTLRAEAETTARLANHTAAAWRGMAKEAGGRLVDACTAHRDQRIADLQPDLLELSEQVREAIVAMRTAQRRYLRKIAEVAWWSELSPHNLPTFTGFPSRAAVEEIDPEPTVHGFIDRTAAAAQVTA